MKNGLCIALLCLASLPTFAQNAVSPDRGASDEASTILAHDYADRIDGLLRDVHTTLQMISERMEARTLSPRQAERLKLAATRAMIGRLETLSAVYDSKLALAASARDLLTSESGAGNDANQQKEMLRRMTVNVRQLEKEERPVVSSCEGSTNSLLHTAPIPATCPKTPFSRQ